MGDVIERRIDSKSGRVFFYNRTARLTGWTREEVDRRPSPAMQRQGQSAAVGTGGVAARIVEHYDEKRGRHYYYNTVTRKTGWCRDDVMPAALGPATAAGGGGGVRGSSSVGGGGGGGGGRSSPNGAGADGAEACIDAQGRTYYFNRHTGKSSWTRAAVAAAQPVPATAAAPSPPSQGQAALDPHVERRVDPVTSRPFFYNRATRKTGWTAADVSGGAPDAAVQRPVPEVHAHATARAAGNSAAHVGSGGASAGIAVAPRAGALATAPPPAAEPPARKPIRARRFSIASERALDRLEECCEQLQDMDVQVQGVETVLLAEKDVTAPIQQMKDVLAVLNGSVEKLQCKDIDSISTHDLSSGKDEARQQRKALTRHADALVSRIKKASSDCATTAAQGRGARPAKAYLFKQGYLCKLNRSGKQWHKRWFILSGNKLIYHDSDQAAYHADASGGLAAVAPTSTKRVIDLLPDTRLAKQRGNSAAVRFQLVTKERTWELRADNNSDLSVWVDSIKFNLNLVREETMIRNPAHALD